MSLEVTAHSARSNESVTSSRPPRAPADLRVVLVDDEAPNRRLAMRLLTRAGVLATNIVVFHDGKAHSVQAECVISATWDILSSRVL